MQLGERFETAGSVLGEREADGASMFGVGRASDEALGFGPVDESDGAVVAKQKVVGDFAAR